MSFEPSRRSFIAAIAALGALAIDPATRLPLSESANERFMRMARNGVVENQRFLIDRPIDATGLNNLVIRNCTFEAKEGFSGEDLFVIREATNMRLVECTFVGSPVAAGAAVRVMLA